MHKFKLYISSKTPDSVAIIECLKTFFEEKLKDQYYLDIIEVLDNFQLSVEDKIFATPTLIKKLPPPEKRIIGDLSNREKILVGLDLIIKE